MEHNTITNSVVSSYLKELGISPALSGYGYLMLAVQIVADLGKRCRILMTRDIYPEIAKAYDTSPSCVERGIRHAISVSYERANSKKFFEIFSFTCSPEKQKPTNAEFIFGLADYIVCQNS